MLFLYCMKIDYKTWDRRVVLSWSIIRRGKKKEKKKPWKKKRFTQSSRTAILSCPFVIFSCPYFFHHFSMLYYFTDWHILLQHWLLKIYTALRREGARWKDDASNAIIFFTLLRDISYCLHCIRCSRFHS